MEEPNQPDPAQMSHFPNELVSNVIKNFGRFALLNARLVSHDWNREIRRHLLKSSEYKIHLTEKDSLQNYIAFQNEHKSGYILPFHLKFAYDNDLEKFVTNVDLLVQMFGKDCVHALHFEFRYPGDNTECMELLITLLDKFASGLKRVQLDGPVRYRNLSETNEAANLLTNHALTLANVTELKIVSYTSSGAFLCWSLIKKCPHVQKLDLLMIAFDNNNIFNDVVSLPLTNVTKLLLYPEILLQPLVQQVIRSQTPLRLKHLTFLWQNYDNGIMSTEAIQVLSSLCENLESLEILIHRRLSFYKHDPLPLPFTAGKIFPRLTSLIIEFYYEPEKSNDLDLVIDPALFPALTFVQFPHNVNLKTQTADDGTPVAFLSVNTLTLYVEYQNPQSIQVFQYKKYGENYLQTFPNVTRVRIIKGRRWVNQVYVFEEYGGHVVREVLKSLIQSDVDASAKIQEVELINCPQNYLGEVFHHQSHPPRIILNNLPRDLLLYKDLLNVVQSIGKFGVDISDGQGITGQTDGDPPSGTVNLMTNVRKLSITMHRWCWLKILKRYKHIASLGEDQSTMIKNVLSKPVELHVDAMLRNLPKLEEINVANVLFGSDENANNELVQDFQTQHPTLKLNISTLNCT